MARNNSSSGPGCGTVLLIAVLAAVAMWHYGMFGRVAVQLEGLASQAASLASEAGVDPEEITPDGWTNVDSVVPGGVPGADIYREPEEGADDYYVYSQLGDEDREKYRIVLDAFRARAPREYPTASIDDLSRIRDCVMADHPELFYINGANLATTVSFGATSAVVEGAYSYTPEEAEAAWAETEDAAAACLAEAPASDDYALAKYVYEYLAESVDYNHDIVWSLAYDLEGPHGQTCVEALVGRSAVCAGYARAFQYLMQRSGIPCVYVTGEANGGAHAWCAAQLDGEWYFIDPTWGDPQFLESDAGFVNYGYLGVTTDDTAQTHVVTCNYPVPDCTSYDDNYYVREGRYLEDFDAEFVGAVLAEARERGETYASIRCSTAEIYSWFLDDLIAGGAIYPYLFSNEIRYYPDDALHTITIAL